MKPIFGWPELELLLTRVWLDKGAVEDTCGANFEWLGYHACILVVLQMGINIFGTCNFRMYYELVFDNWVNALIFLYSRFSLVTSMLLARAALIKRNVCGPCIRVRSSGRLAHEMQWIANITDFLQNIVVNQKKHLVIN